MRVHLAQHTFEHIQEEVERILVQEVNLDKKKRVHVVHSVYTDSRTVYGLIIAHLQLLYTWLSDSRVKYIDEQAVDSGRYCWETLSTSSMTVPVSSTLR